MQCHLPNFCSANCAWGICLCCLPFGFPYISISGSSGGSEWILNFISVFNFCSRTLQCKLFASTFCFTLQRTKTFLNRPTGLFLGISWKKGMSREEFSGACTYLSSEGGTSAKWSPLNSSATNTWRNVGQTGSSHCVPRKATMQE